MAIRDFEGGVVIISHKNDFLSAITSEYWFVNDGNLTRRVPEKLSLRSFEEGGSQCKSALTEASSAISSVAKSGAENNMDTGDDMLKVE